MSDFRYIVCLGTEGFEGLCDITDIGEELTILKLAGDNPSEKVVEVRTFFQITSLRNRMNSHRRIKCYGIDVPLEADEFREALITSKSIRDSVRSKGQEVHL